MATSEAAGLKAVSSIRYRIATASGDERQLSEVLRTQLVPLLDKAGSPHKAVRDEAFKAYISVTKFIQLPSVILPVASLLKQYKTSSSPVVKQLDLGLVKKGIFRLDQYGRRELLPVVAQSISKETNPSSASGIFIIFLRLLLEIQLPSRGSKDDISLRETLGLIDSSDAKYIAEWLGKFLLLRQDLAFAAAGDLDAALATTPSGLTKAEVEFLRSNDPKTWKPSETGNLSLPECKLKAVSFLSSGAFTDNERFLPTVSASGSADSRISSVAEDTLKRSNVNLEDYNIVRSLFEAHNKLPASHRIQILKLLSKSAASCASGSEVVETIRVDFELTSGENPTVNGLEAVRLHKALLGFLAWIARNKTGSQIEDHDTGPKLVLLLKDYVLKQGWPDPVASANQSQYQDEQRLRANAYETIGALARGSRFEQKAKDSLLKWLFDSLVSDPSPDIVVYIESALSSMMGLFKYTTEVDHRDLEILLLDYMTLSDRQGIRTAKHVATRFANNCLPYSNIKARWIDMLALSGGSSGRRDVFEEGQRGLDPWWASKLRPDEDLLLPDWTKLTQMLFDSEPRYVGSDEMAVDQTSAYPLFPNERLQAFPIAIKYVTQILLLGALNEGKVDIDWESQLESRFQNDLKTRSLARAYMTTADHDSLLNLLNAAFDGIRDHADIGAEECVRCLADLLSFAPSETVVSRLSGRAQELLAMAKSNNHKIRQLASKAFGILAPWSDQATNLVSQLRGYLSSCKQPSAAQSAEYQGSLAFLCSYFCHAAFYGKIRPADASDHTDFLYELFASSLALADANIRDVAIEAVSQLWTANMGFPAVVQKFKETTDTLEMLAKSNNEKAISALGRLAVPSLAKTDAVSSVLEILFGLSEIKRVEVHFATGEAIAAVIARWDSEAVKLGFDVEPLGTAEEDMVKTLCRRPDRITESLEKLINDCKTTRPSLLKASGIWLFCIIQYCSHLKEVQSRLRECQVAFMRLLTARDELVQETASRGLALVYERGDATLKGELVKDLIATFTGTKTQLKVDQDTELFDEGALPTGEGKSVTSYKDIISLANEVGDQSLIYKFMALATNAATWTARSAFGRFGLSNILSDAELDPKIYPKLYRYRFDPNSNVRRSMDDIWKAVVKDQTIVIDTYFDAIMDDLLKSILDGREWRVREASCAAIAELIYGQPFPKYENYYAEIWRVALKVLDDQKGSVRAAALKMCMGLSKTLVTQLQENNNTSSAKSMIAQVLPFLLSDKGIENSVKEVKYLSISTVLDVVKNGGETLKPFIPTIVIHCLGLLGTIEPEGINYYYQRVGEEDREQLDKLRSSAATRSPMFECIGNCLRFADEDVMKDLAPELAQTVKSAIGMQTKVGCGEVLSTLALRHSILLPPYNAMFLKIMETQILDRNHEVSKAYTRSCAYLLRTAAAETLDQFASKLVDLYLAAEDEIRRQKIADAVLAIAKVSPDTFTDLESRLLPFVYMAKHDTDDYVSEEFTEAWNQHAGGSHTVVRFVDEITECVSMALGTSKWALLHGAAQTITSMITQMSSAVGKDGQFSGTSLQKIWPVLEKALALKTFKGKEKLVVAFPIFIRHSKKFWGTDAAVAAQMKKIAIREAKRNNDEYRPHAIEALAQFAAERDDLDMFGEVKGVVVDYLNPDSPDKLTELQRNTTAAALKAAMTAYNRPNMRQDPVSVLGNIIATVEGAQEAASIARDTWYTSIVEVMKTAEAPPPPPNSKAITIASKWFTAIAVWDADVVMVESQRLSQAKAINAFVDKCNQGIFGPAVGQEALRQQMNERLLAMVKAERSLDVQKVLKQAVQKLTDTC
ncbi:proteasome stabiliser-domain-containing protein [Pseudomassariella vexata]|uniref:Proteasome stabiliser-domain-containing protein n=1 Tax=Pseudomassariella vexata TaxID=1141098 RepID=A0A1Y2DT70_9PEZI|nr:proteasome stabiliser-domain-containing protein [Pseudomassariella vexata]ORY62472.1 proteasome stabiliser-domain-containing protein [Pseudomassariella vexata]